MGPLIDPSEEPSTMTNVTTIGLDIAKSSFTLCGIDCNGATVLKKTLKRAQVLKFFAELPPCRAGLEACGSAHHWAREIATFGHEVRLIPPSRVKRFVERQKNDAADARAIADAMTHPETRFVAVKTVEQQSHLMLFKARDLLVMQRTQLMNALRGHFGETGIVAPKGAREVHGLIDLVMKDEGLLPPAMRQAMQALISALTNVSEEIAELERSILRTRKSDERAKRLAEVPGIGTLTAMVLPAAIPDFHAFRNGREFAAYLGLVPRQSSTGGKPKLGPITKMGNRDIRRLLVVGSIAILARFKHNAKGGALGDWARKLLETKPFRLAAVALANKLARIAWAIMAKGESYDSNHALKGA
jgi:transposase